MLKGIRIGTYLNTYIILIGYVDREHYCLGCFIFFHSTWGNARSYSQVSGAPRALTVYRLAKSFFQVKI